MMTNAQLAKYHVLKKQWSDARKARGAAADQATLDALQVRTIGRASSSKNFTQADLDKMVAAFLAETDGGNLNAQLAQLDQPEARRARLEARIFAAGARIVTPGATKDQTEWRVINYVGGIVSNMGEARRWPILEERLLGKLAGILEARAARARGTKAPLPVDADCPY
jgi:hypothetical protein